MIPGEFPAGDFYVLFRRLDLSDLSVLFCLILHGMFCSVWYILFGLICFVWLLFGCCWGLWYEEKSVIDVWFTMCDVWREGFIL